mmetsp:Transcript_12340/g.40550  ORF Transcript_12340/g.40550 Transcript_12340/m.40550 type:complete len:331 (-) Transcript_12340:1109-2101(-)
MMHATRGALHAPAQPLAHMRAARTRPWAPLQKRMRAAGEGDAPTEEDMMARLAAAEAEAERLRAELATKEASSTASPGAAPSGEDDSLTVDQLARKKPAKPANRIDSYIPGGGRESIFGTKTGGSWLSEDDLAMLAKVGPGETYSEGGGSVSGVAPEDEGVVGRRLAIGLGLSAAFVVLALQPSTSGPPPKPLFFYLVPLLRSQALLEQAETVVADANWAQLAPLLRGVEEANEAKKNLMSAAASLPSPQRQDQARALASEFLEYVQQADYKKYFDQKSTPTGTQQAEFAAFSLRSIKAAEGKLAAFLKLMPADDVQAARSQLSAFEDAI